jgi:hypothetical protein
VFAGEDEDGVRKKRKERAAADSDDGDDDDDGGGGGGGGSGRVIPLFTTYFLRSVQKTPGTNLTPPGSGNPSRAFGQQLRLMTASVVHVTNANPTRRQERAALWEEEGSEGEGEGG